MTSLVHLGEQGASALELFVEPLNPPAAAAGAGTDSSRRGSAASSAGSGPTLFPFSEIEADDREVESEEPFAGPDIQWDGQDPPGEGAAALGAAPVDPVVETSPNISDQVKQDPEHSLGGQPTAAGPIDLSVQASMEDSNSLNPVDQDQPVPMQDEPEEFVPPERLIAQASSTPYSPPVPTSNIFDPLGDDDESTAKTRRTKTSLDGSRSSTTSRLPWKPPQPRPASSRSLQTSRLEDHSRRMRVAKPLLQARDRERGTTPAGEVAGPGRSTSPGKKTSPMGQRASTSALS